MLKNLVWTYTYGDDVQQNAGPKYDMVFIIGPDTPTLEVEKLREDAANSGLRICIIGDGDKESFLSKEALELQLSGKIDANTNIHILGHGSAKKVGKNDYTTHTTSIYPEFILNGNIQSTETYSILYDLKEIFDKDPDNKDKKMTADLFSCHGGAVAERSPDIKLTLHSGKKYTTSISMSFDAVSNAIERRKNKSIEDPYESFMHSIVSSPETAIYTEDDEFFKASAPKEPLSVDLERYLRWQLTKFLRFRRDALDQKEIGSDTDIAKKVKDFPITPDTLKRYNELALLIECQRSKNSQHAKKYVEEYLEKGTDVNTTLSNGNAPLHLACINTKLSVMGKLLASKNINVNLGNNDGETPLWIASHDGFYEAVYYLLEADNILIDKTTNDGQTPVWIASQEGCIFALRELIKAGANINQPDNEGITPVWKAAQNGHLQIVEELIQAGADILQPSIPGDTPFFMACKNGYAAIAKTLLDKGADYNNGLYNSFTPLMAAAMYGQKDVVALLLSHITDVDPLKNPSMKAQ